MRLDKWLWAARFYKSRQLAIDAINGGKVHVNGQRCKPGKEIAIGTAIQIQRDQLTWDITVKDLKSARRPANEAALLFEESPESQAKREAAIEQRKLFRTFHGLPDRRPNKRDRRLIQQFKRVADDISTGDD